MIISPAAYFGWEVICLHEHFLDQKKDSCLFSVHGETFPCLLVNIINTLPSAVNKAINLS